MTDQRLESLVETLNWANKGSTNQFKIFNKSLSIWADGHSLYIFLLTISANLTPFYTQKLLHSTENSLRISDNSYFLFHELMK